MDEHADNVVCSATSTDDDHQRSSSPEWMTEDESFCLSDGSRLWLDRDGSPAFVARRSKDVEGSSTMLNKAVAGKAGSARVYII